MRMADLSFSKKLYSAFGVIIALMIVLGILFYSFFSATISANQWNVHTYRVIDESRALTENLINMETGLRGFAIAGNDDLLAPYRAGDQKFKENLTKIQQLTRDNPVQQARLQKLEGQKTDWINRFADPLIKSRKAVTNGNISMADFTAGFMSNTGQIQMDAMRATLDEIANTEASLLAVRTAELEKLQVKTKTVLVGGTLIAAVFAFLFASWIVRLVTPSLRQAVKLAEAIAEGDLTRSITARSKDEIGRLLYALANMQKKLTAIVSGIKLSTDSITSAAKEVSAGNADLSSRTEQQAASLEETAASMEELTSTVKQNADNATEANTLAVNAAELANTGNNVVNRVVNIMGDINQSSTKIADITGIIEGIAFQTNILALNAAVEAARAGEQGRGFAVVASEVRTLAQRSSSAAKEIKELISASVDKVRNGMTEADEAGRTMAQVTSAIDQVTAIMSEIAAASTEQGRGIEQVNQAISQMDTVTQQNAALVEEAAAAAQSLEDQGLQLQATVSTFRIQNTAKPIALADDATAPGLITASRHAQTSGKQAAPALIESESMHPAQPDALMSQATP